MKSVSVPNKPVPNKPVPDEEDGTPVLYTVSFTLTVPVLPVPVLPVLSTPMPTGATGATRARTTGVARSVDFLDREEAEAFARVLLRGSREEGGEELVSAVEVHEEEWFAPVPMQTSTVQTSTVQTSK